MKSAKILLEAGEHKSANNRVYYAIFHAIILVNNEFIEMVEQYCLKELK